MFKAIHYKKTRRIPTEIPTDDTAVGHFGRNSDRFPTKTKNLKSSEFRRLIPTNFRENMGRRNIPTTFRRYSDKQYNRCSRRKVVGIFRQISDDMPMKRYNRYGRRYSVGIFRRISDEPSDRCRQINMTVL